MASGPARGDGILLVTGAGPERRNQRQAVGRPSGAADVLEPIRGHRAVLAQRAIVRRAGMRMFQAVIVFGLASVVFALSRLLWLSLLAPLIMGAADTVSMVIRISLVQLRTPNAMRGRVGAVNYLFVNRSAG